MGNWRTVRLVGECPEEQVEDLRDACSYGAGLPLDQRDYSKFHCLSMTDGLAGIGPWVGHVVNADGNLAERDYTVDDVADKLRELALVAPGLRLKVHCGGDWESEECVATVTLDEGGVSVGDPEVEKLGGVTEETMLNRFIAQTRGPW